MNPEVTAQLLALPSLRKQAEEDARESLSIFLGGGPDDDQSWTLWGDMTQETHRRAIDHHAALLADFTRWQSQAWALRRIGELLGWDAAWLAGGSMFNRGGGTWFFLAEGAAYYPDPKDIPGIHEMTRPEAIAAILLHLESQ